MSRETRQTMSIMPGTKVGRYEIRSKLGAGGMGEVYLARDVQLDRMVALKILPAIVARDQQRFHRFLQEARAASALSHPNVAHIYEITEERLGLETLHFIAMEFIEGEPLDVKIAGRPLGNAQLLDIATQIADALDEAHAKGIIHRDIKSSNIMITPRGRVKVLDFGLAKVGSAVPGSDVPSDSEVATRVKTSPGVVMGTVNFMSPEQALGREVDQRSDIFSLGVVLYQMATGRLPFTGDTVTETIDHIAHAQPEAIARFNYDVLPAVEQIIKKALRKDRDERYQTIHDLLVDLREARRELDVSDRLERSVPPPQTAFPHSGTSLSVPTTLSERTTAQVSSSHTASSAEYIVGEMKRHKIAAMIFVGALLILVAAGAFGLYRFAFSKRQPLETGALRVTAAPNMKMTRLTSNGKALQATISPDGKWVAYEQKDGGKVSLWIRQIATGSNVQIVPPSEAKFFRETFSPDGNYVYYKASDKNNPSGALYQVPSLGGPSRKILTNIASPITFSPDGSRIAYFRTDVAASGEDQLWVANADGSNERKLTARKGDAFFDYGGPGWSPDGKVIACSAGSYKGGFHLFVIVVNAETGEQIEFSKHEFSDSGRISWLSDGSGMVVNAADYLSLFTQLWQISYPGGEAQRITSDLAEYLGTGLTADSKTLVSVQYDGTANIWVSPVADFERGRQITNGKYEGWDGLNWTPDGRIVYTSNTNGSNDIYIMNEDGSDQRALTADPHRDYGPTVSPDGRIVLFTSGRGGFPSLWRMNIDGSQPTQLTNNQEDYGPRISPDGQSILFSSWRSGRKTLWKVGINGGEPIQVIDKFTSGGNYSPDGKFIACFYVPEQPDLPAQILVLPAEGGEAIKSFATARPGLEPDPVLRWSPDGGALLYLDSRSGAQNIWSQNLDGGAPKQLTDFKDTEVRTFAFSPDGRKIAMVRFSFRSDVVLIRDFR